MGENCLALFCDAHFHLVPAKEALGGLDFPLCRAATCAHSQKEFLEQEKLILMLNDFAERAENEGAAKNAARLFSRAGEPGGKPKNAAPSLAFRNVRAQGGPRLLPCFGLHPQMPFDGERGFSDRLDFLEDLLRQKRICALGECGFDFYSEEFSQNRKAQEAAFHAQTALAARYGVPAIVHARKAMQDIFKNAAILKSLPAVVFHSFAGTLQDARSLLNKGVNAYFSFGKPLLNGAKKAILCVKSLPLERLLFETDAPYQTLKGERATSPAEIALVYQAAFELRNAGVPFEARPSFFDFCARIERNFRAALESV